MITKSPLYTSRRVEEGQVPLAQIMTGVVVAEGKLSVCSIKSTSRDASFLPLMMKMHMRACIASHHHFYSLIYDAYPELNTFTFYFLLYIHLRFKWITL